MYYFGQDHFHRFCVNKIHIDISGSFSRQNLLSLQLWRPLPGVLHSSKISSVLFWFAPICSGFFFFQVKSCIIYSLLDQIWSILSPFKIPRNENCFPRMDIRRFYGILIFQDALNFFFLKACVLGDFFNIKKRD